MSFYFHDLYTLLLFFSSIVIVFLVFFDKNRIILILQYVFNQKYIVSYHRKDPWPYKFFVGTKTLLVFTTALSLYVFHKNGHLSGRAFLSIMVLLFFLFAFKVSINYFLCLLIEQEDHYQKYYYGYTSSLFFCSIAFLPIIIFASYFEDGLLVLKTPLIIFYVFACTYIISLTILYKRLNLFQRAYFFYNILYLCLLEVLPYVAVFQLFDVIL